MKERISSILAYLLFVIGWVYVLIVDRKNKTAMFHVKQSMGLVLYVVGSTLLWVVVGFLLAMIPYYGAIMALLLFTIVICVYLSAAVLFIVGIVNAANGKAAPLPIVGGWANRLPIA